MTGNFLDLARTIKKEVLTVLPLAEDSYLGSELNRIIHEWEAGRFTQKATQIGLAALQMLSSEDQKLISAICELEDLYNQKIGRTSEGQPPQT